jgi:tRNA U34 5-carboxymethylaminomethyl modifying GTPase MnmE/TrmE
MEKTFEIEDELKELKDYLKKAAKSGKVDKEFPFSMIERTVAILENAVKKIEELEERLDLVEGKF